MDSHELFDIIHPFDRTKSDKLMVSILEWVRMAVPIEYVYTPEQMGAWALRNGYEKRDTDQLCALLKQTQAYVVRGTPLSIAINDALAERRSIHG